MKVIALIVPGVLAFSLLARAQEPPTTPQAAIQEVNSWVKIVESARPAVVVIETEKGFGSGFFIKLDGTLVTNHHVIEGAQGIRVKLASGEVYSRVFILVSDPTQDIAVLRIEAVDVPVLPLGNSNDAKVGEEVLLLGAPRGLEQTVSNGLISSIRVTESGLRVIQTTAPASPGSSGGPLLNSRGEAVGLLSFSVVQGQNLNFAIPINYVRGKLEALVLSAPPQVVQSSDPPLDRGSRKRSGIFLTGYGAAGIDSGTFEGAYLQLLDFLSVHGVDMMNEATSFTTMNGRIVSLNYYLDHLSEIGASSLLYMTVEHGWSNIHRIKLQCFDAHGQLLWEERASSSNTWAATESGAAHAVVGQLEKKVLRHVGGAGLPLKNAQSQRTGNKETPNP